MTIGYYKPYYQDIELEHYGIKGQKWGIRRYQNKDGSLTNAGKKRYSSKDIANDRSIFYKKLKEKYKVDEAYKIADANYNKAVKKLGYDPDPEEYYKYAEQQAAKVYKELDKMLKEKYGSDYIKKQKAENILLTAGVLGGTAASVLAFYGSIKLTEMAAKGVTELGTSAIKKILKI